MAVFATCGGPRRLRGTKVLPGVSAGGMIPQRTKAEEVAEIGPSQVRLDTQPRLRQLGPHAMAAGACSVSDAGGKPWCQTQGKKRGFRRRARNAVEAELHL